MCDFLNDNVFTGLDNMILRKKAKMNTQILLSN